MASEDTVGWTLEEALRRWCPPQLVSDYDTISAAMMRAGVKPSFLYGLSGAAEHSDPFIRDASRMNAEYERARNALHQDFRSRLIQGEMKLTGVQTKPGRCTTVATIPGSWAADFNFDFASGTIRCAEYRWVAVTASLGSPAAQGAEQAPQLPEPVIIWADQVATLDDETVLALLEEHARRVVESPDARLIAPGKISLMPIILRKMLHRAQTGATRGTLAAEASELAEWIATKVSSHQVPSAGAIENALRNDYRKLKP